MFYSVNKKTKEHRANVIIRGIDWFSVEADADGWIECDGEHRPIDANQEIQWKGSNGFVSGVIPANCVFWGENGADKITAYRPILNSQPEKPVEWDGEGLPPVGTVCEGYVQDIASVWRWLEVEILKHHNIAHSECAVHVTKHTILRWCDQFRPIRTDRERWIESALGCDCDPHQGMLSRRDFCGAIYDAGLAKMPEDK